jgi:hypothetical protein
MKTINEQEFQDWKAKQTDGYGQRIFSYAEDWANMMEQAMAEDKVDVSSSPAVLGFIVRNADRFSGIADTDGITGYMYGAAVATLAKCWVHGEQLRRWHNKETQIGNEGDEANKSGGVLNPAILNIGAK